MIEVPHRVRDHLRQRRRIKVGNEQVTSVLGAAPSTLIAYALRSPARALALVRQSVLSERNGLFRLAWLGASETAAKALAVWDRVPPRKDHVRWQRIEGATALAPTRPPLDTSESGARNGAEIGLELRVAALIESAGCFGTGLSLEDLVTLLPRDGPATPEAMRRWLATRPSIGRIEGDRIFSPQVPPISVEARRARGLDYRSLARAVIHRRLGKALPLLRCLGITGSTAYGEPQAGDDVDFLVVTRTGATWLFLGYTYLVLRFGRKMAGEPDLCFNFVLDDIEAPREFARGRGFLYAREALTTGILWGEEYYRHLLGSAPWMAEELPRLFDERADVEGPLPPRGLPVLLRWVNACLFPLLATYLRLVGLRRNHRLGRRGSDEAIFRTEIGPRRLAFLSRRFEALRRMTHDQTHASHSTDRRWPEEKSQRESSGAPRVGPTAVRPRHSLTGPTTQASTPSRPFTDTPAANADELRGYRSAPSR